MLQGLPPVVEQAKAMPVLLDIVTWDVRGGAAIRHRWWTAFKICQTARSEEGVPGPRLGAARLALFCNFSGHKRSRASSKCCLSFCFGRIGWMSGRKQAYHNRKCFSTWPWLCNMIVLAATERKKERKKERQRERETERERQT